MIAKNTTNAARLNPAITILVADTTMSKSETTMSEVAILMSGNTETKAAPVAKGSVVGIIAKSETKVSV